MFEIKATKGYVLSFDEKERNLFLSAGTVKKVHFPELNVEKKIGNIRNAGITQSQDGRYLLLYNSDRKIALFQTDDLEHPVLTHLWKEATSGIRCIEHDGYFYIPVSESLYRIGKLPDIQLTKCYCRPKSQEDSPSEGFIQSVCCEGEDILIVFCCYRKNNILIRLNPQSNTVKQTEFPFDLFSYETILPSQTGGFFLHSMLPNKPLLYFKEDIDSAPVKEIDLPTNHNCCLSHNNKYLAGYSVRPDQNGHMTCWLMEMDSGKILLQLNDRLVFSVGFSLHDEYWLIGSNHALLIPIKSIVNQ